MTDERLVQLNNTLSENGRLWAESGRIAETLVRICQELIGAVTEARVQRELTKKVTPLEWRYEAKDYAAAQAFGAMFRCYKDGYARADFTDGEVRKGLFYTLEKAVEQCNAWHTEKINSLLS